jgi:Domain of unknown function (DUF4432)
LRRRFALDRPGKYPVLELQNGERGRVDVVPAKDARTEDVLLFSDLPEGLCSLRNPKQKIQVELRWDASVFPYMWCWQVYGGSYGYPYYGRLYTVAVEPFNCPIEPLDVLVEKGTARILEPGSAVETQLEIEVSAD